MGIDLSIESRIVVTAQASCVLRGSYRLPLLRHHLIGVDGLDAEATLSNFEEPVATIPKTLLLTGSETPGPFLIAMHIPSYDELIADSVAVEAIGTFALDLLETEALGHHEPQIYYLYAFSDKVLAGPFKVELLRDEA